MVKPKPRTVGRLHVVVELERGPALLPDGKLPEPRRLTADELPNFVSGDSKHVILDLRNDRVAFMQRHLTGSLFAPLTGGKLPIVAGSYVDEHAAIILVVHEESEVDEAVRQLVRIGLDKAESWIPVDEALPEHLENDDLTASVTRITTAELAGALAAHPGAGVLDVRSTGEYVESHVRGSKHIPYTQLAARLAEVPHTHPLYVHCGSGLRASFAVPLLVRESRDVILVDGAFGEISTGLLTKNSTAEFAI